MFHGGLYLSETDDGSYSTHVGQSKEERSGSVCIVTQGKGNTNV